MRPGSMNCLMISTQLFLNFLKITFLRRNIHEMITENYWSWQCFFLVAFQRREILFRIPGAVSRARWMAKAIYAFKIYLFEDQFHVSKREKNSLRRICIFLARVYIRAWFLSTEAIKAPYQDLQFTRELIKYQDIDPEISTATGKKFSNHLWY